MDEVQIDERTQSEEEEAFDPRTPIRKPSVVKLQKRRDNEKHRAAACDYRASSKHMRGGKRSVKFSPNAERITFVDLNLPPFFARQPIRSESPEMDSEQQSTAAQPNRPEALAQQSQAQQTQIANPQAQMEASELQQPQVEQQTLQQMIQQVVQQVLPQLQQEIQRLVQQQPTQSTANSRPRPPPIPSNPSQQQERLLTRPLGGAGRGTRPAPISSLQQNMYRALNESAETIEINT